jgi:hypothetical protein
MDNLVFEESVNSELSQSEFVDKQWLYVNDNNNSSYSSQIVLDTTPLANSGGYINWSEAFIAIPLVLQIESDAIGLATNSGGFPLDWAVGLKSGFWQVIHSLTCEFNNGNIIQQVPFLNIFCSYKNLTSWSQNDIKNWGAITGFYPDSPRTWIYNYQANSATNRLSANGTGLCNNRLAPYFNLFIEMAAVAGDAAQNANVVQSLGTTVTYANSASNNFQTLFNTGLSTRIAWLNFDLTLNSNTFAPPGAPSAVSPFSSNQSALLGNAGTNNLTFQSYVNSSFDNCRAIVFDAVVRLKDVADFFQKCPLLKGSTMRIYLNTNQCYFPLNITSGTATAATNIAAVTQTAPQSLSLGAAPVILGGGATCPIMVGSADLGQPLYNLNPLADAVDVVTANVALSIVKTQFTQQMANVITAPITSCRLYAPCYTMSPIAEQRFLSLTPTKKVLYNDIFQYQFQGLQAGQFNLLVSNGISNVRQVVVVPLLNQTGNGVAGAGNYVGATTNTLLSPFATTGGTPDPIQITNFNIQVSGKNLFLQQLQYNYEDFYQQVVSSNQLNGSLTTSLSSGLVGYEDWTNLYRYYVGNCSRSLPSEDGVAKAIQILGTIPQASATLQVNLMVFVVFEREITIDLRTGARVA